MKSERKEVRFSEAVLKAISLRAEELGLGFSSYIKFVVAQDLKNNPPRVPPASTTDVDRN